MLLSLTPDNLSLPLTKIPKIVILHLRREKEHFRTAEFNTYSFVRLRKWFYKQTFATLPKKCLIKFVKETRKQV